MSNKLNFASFSICYFLICNHIGISLREFTNLPSWFPNFVFLTGVIPIWLVRSNRGSVTRMSPSMQLITLLFSMIISLSALALITSAEETSFSSFAKLGGLVLVYPTLVFCSGQFRTAEIKSGLLAYAFAELALMAITWTEWNPNSVAARSMTAGITLFFLSQNAFIRYPAFAITLLVAFVFQSRTVLLGTLTSLLATLSIKKKKIFPVAVIAGTLLLVFVLLFSFEIASQFKTTAKNSLNSKNPISQFFLSDKSEKDIDHDFLDRRRNWESAIYKIWKNPVFGHGFGADRKNVENNEFSSHNAYLGIAVESGIPALVGWLLVYAVLAKTVIYRKNFESSPDDEALRALVVFFLIYMVLSGILETSGLGSILAPINLIFMLVSINALSHQSSEYQQKNFASKYE